MKHPQAILLSLWFAVGMTLGCAKTNKHENNQEEHPKEDAKIVDKVKDFVTPYFKSPAKCVLPQEKRATKYPIVLHHGFLAGRRAGQFINVKGCLEKQGYKVFQTEVSAINTSELRGHQLADQLRDILARTKAEKVNIIAHSQGGLDARFAISYMQMSNRVASLSTIASPHRGTPVADLALDHTSAKSQVALNLFLNFMGRAINERPDPSTLNAIKGLSEAYMKDVFNPANPDQPSVFYQSWSAVAGGKKEDQLKPLLLIPYYIIKLSRGDNDGIVTTSSSKWGQDNGLINADHLDILGYRILDKDSSFDHIQFISNVAKGLMDKGF